MRRPLSVVRGLAMVSLGLAMVSGLTVSVQGQGITSPVSAVVIDEAFNPISGAGVQVTGEMGFDGGCITNAAGECNVSYSVEPADGELLTATSTVPGIGTGTDTETYGILGVRFIIVLAPSPTEITINKVDQRGAPLPGACFEATGADSGLAVARCDSNDLADDGVTTISGEFSSGETVTITETVVPAGCTAESSPRTLVIDGSGAQAIDFTNVCVASGPSDLTIRKLDQFGNMVLGAAFSVTNTADPLDTVMASDDADGVSDGLSTASGLTVGATYAVTETTVPAGCTAGDPETVTMTGEPMVDVVTMTNVCSVAGDGSEVNVTVLISDDPALAGSSEYIVSGPITGAAVTPGAGVTVTFVNDGTGAVTTDVTDASGFASVTLPAGTYTISNSVAPGEETITIDGVLDYELTIIAYPADPDSGETTGDVEIVKLYCESAELAGEVEFDVLGPETPVEVTGVTGQAGAVGADNCTPGAAEFTIYPFGDTTAEPITVTVGSDGVIVIDDIIPVTTDAEAHELVEAGTGAETLFDVEAGAVTQIIVINYVGTSDGAGEQPGGEGPGEIPIEGGTTGGGVTSLPDTGAGGRQIGVEAGMALFLTLGGLAAAGVSLRRRVA